MTRTIIVIAAGLALAVTLPAVSAQAQNGTLTRSFVSSAGVDTNPCTITQPCASFAHAYTVIGANGIIAALDPGKYGPITIAGPVTINGNGWAAITGTAAGNGITINAGSGNVILTGLEIDGAAAANNGIVFNSGGSLTVIDCKFYNFTNDGILIQPGNNSLVAAISNANVANNGHDGIQITGNVSVIISNTYAMNNVNDGVDISGNAGYDYAGISNTIAAYNGNNGFEFLQETNANLSNVRADENGLHGIYVSAAGVGPQVIKNSEGSANPADLIVNAGGVILINNNALGSVIINSAGGATGVADGTNYIGWVSGTLGTQSLH